MSDDKISRFPKTKRPTPDEVALELVPPYAAECKHLGGITVDEALTEVTCSDCRAKLSPMWVLARLAEHESRWKQQREAFMKQAKEYNSRTRCKCQHCGQMTRIKGL